MAARRHVHLALVCFLALLATGALSACGKTHKPGDALREGLSQPLDHLRYTVFLTRQLNLKDTEDSGYVPGMKEAAPGHGLFALFVEACNKSKHTANAMGTDRFTIVDAQGEVFHALALGAQNPFAFHGGPVPTQNCMPARGSLAQQGPTSGAVVLFDLPLAATENRPLELHIQGNGVFSTGKPEVARVILDI